MYGNFGFDDSEQYDRFKDFYDGLLGATPPPTDDGFQARQMQVPALAQGLLEPVTQQLSDLGENGSDVAAAMAQTAQQKPAGNGQNRIAQQQQANQAAMQQSQQNSGGGLLGNLLKIGANIALNNWIGGMFPKKTG